MARMGKREKEARALLDAEIDRFTKGLRDYVQDMVHNKIDVDKVLDGMKDSKRGWDNPSRLRARIVLGYVMRSLYEDVSELLGEEEVANMFDDSFFFIAGRHIGGEDFQATHAPVHERVASLKRKIEDNRKTWDGKPENQRSGYPKVAEMVKQGLSPELLDAIVKQL